VIFGLHNTTLANWIVVAIDSEFSAVLKEARPWVELPEVHSRSDSKRYLDG